MVELLAAIPSVVLGLWGILVMGPFLAEHVEPWLSDHLGFIPLFSGYPSSQGVLPACVVLSIMVVPIVASISRELFLSVPSELKQGAMALGATRWEMVRSVMLPYVSGGLVASTMLGFGRAVGEAIAVTQVIGGANAISRSLFPPGDTMASRIAAQYAGTATSLQRSSLAYLAVLLLDHQPDHQHRRAADLGQAAAAAGRRGVSAQDDRNPLTVVSPRSRRRKLQGRLMELLASVAALVAIVVLLVVIFSVAKRGLPAVNVDLFTQVAAPFGVEGGGIKNAIVGTLIMTAMATAMAVPIGVLLAIFDTEFASPQVSVAIRMTLNVLAGVPTIVIGIFIFGLVVVSNGQSAFAASIALAIIILPVIARATEEVLLLVPSTLREGSMALGATRARTVVSVILPSAFGGIVTATIVGVARAAGETAPILFTSSIFANAVVTDPSQPMASMPFAIFTNSESPSHHDQQVAWAAALVLMAFVLLGSITGRLLSLRTRRQIEQMR